MLLNSFIIVMSIVNNESKNFLLICEDYQKMKREISQLEDCLIALDYDFNYNKSKDTFTIGNVKIVFAVTDTFGIYGYGREYLQITLR